MSEKTAVLEPETEADEVAEVAPVAPVDGQLVEEDLLIEDVSIDGMCGVY